MTYDVAIVGGGPAGSSAGCILKKYRPDLSVAIFEREKFPRDHVGESLLPIINSFLNEMGVWEEVEKANFPVKVGATYRWGSTQDLWTLEFIPDGQYQAEERPAPFQGQRKYTSFQVDRAIYDKILLDHARKLGCEVHEETQVVEVQHSGDRVDGLRIRSKGAENAPISDVTARYYIDASASGMIRRTFNVEVEYPTALRNVAIWDYWRNADWAVKVGGTGTRINILSLGYGWIWFIPIGPERTSIGLVLPAEYLKKSGSKPAEIYAKALLAEPRVQELLASASPENSLRTTNDWSYISSRLSGENWFLAGDACGFADPILSAGCTLAHASGREVAYILAGATSPDRENWLKQAYDENHRRRILQHIRFADYWYCANAQFENLVEYCSAIAKDAGLNLEPDEAFLWLSTGGFANDDLGQASVGLYSLTAAKAITQIFAGKQGAWEINKYNDLRLDMSGVKAEERPLFQSGEIHAVKALVKGQKVLRLTGPFREAYFALQKAHDLREILSLLKAASRKTKDPEHEHYEYVMALEAMIVEGWVKGNTVKGKPVGARLELPMEIDTLHYERDLKRPVHLAQSGPDPR